MPKLKDTKDLDLTKGFKELEDIAGWFEKGETNLDQAVVKFERAMMIADELKKHLMQAENKVKEIKKQFNLE